MYLGKTHLPALQKGIFFHLHGRPVGVEDMPFRFSRASKFNSEDGICFLTGVLTVGLGLDFSFNTAIMLSLT